MKRTVRSALILAVAVAGVLSMVEGVRIYAKAVLAQILLQNAWSDTQKGNPRARPWPWADTWPVARLSSAEHGQDMIVLAGATGRTLAFGPAHLLSSAQPGETGNTVLIGHRDQHFSFLEHLAPGDVLRLEAPDGARYRYLVSETAVVHETETAVMASGGEKMLTLITCYPFNAIVPGGPLRYVVKALPDSTG